MSNLDKVLYILIGFVIGAMLAIILVVPRVAEATFRPQPPLPKITICHTPPKVDQTKRVPITAVPGHLRHGDYLGPCKDIPEEPEEPTPTPAPEEPGNGWSPEPEGNRSTTGAPAHRVCTIPFTPAINWYEDGEFKWATDESVDKFSIVYGPSEDELIYGIDNIPSDSRGVEIERPNWAQTWFQVWSWKDGCAEKSLVIDP